MSNVPVHGPNPRTVMLVVGVAIVAVLAAFLVITTFVPGPSHVASGPAGSRCVPPSLLRGPRIVSCAGVVDNVTPVSTPAVAVTAGSLGLVFVSYVNFLIGGGEVESLTDSHSDDYTLLASTGLASNHTESLYATNISSADPNFVVSVVFGGGVTPQGGSVAFVDVNDSTTASVDGIATNGGDGGVADATVHTYQTGDLFLLGTAGRGVSGPYSPYRGDTLLTTGTATGGPFEDGVGYGAFAMAPPGTNDTLNATLNVGTWWVAIGVAVATTPLTLGSPSVAAHSGTVNNDSTVTAGPIAAANRSLLLLFVSYANSLDGGGTPTSIEDSAGDSYSLLTSTELALNHTEELYVTPIFSADARLVVSVTFGGGATPQGGSVAVVDVANATFRSIDAVGETTGTGGTANLTLSTKHAGDVFVLGTSGRGVSAPYSAAPGMTLLNTGTNTSGPFLDGTGYGTFTTTSSSTTVFLSADLNVATGWEAVGVAID